MRPAAALFSFQFVLGSTPSDRGQRLDREGDRHGSARSSAAVVWGRLLVVPVRYPAKFRPNIAAVRRRSLRPRPSPLLFHACARISDLPLAWRQNCVESSNGIGHPETESLRGL